MTENTFMKMTKVQLIENTRYVLLLYYIIICYILYIIYNVYEMSSTIDLLSYSWLDNFNKVATTILYLLLGHNYKQKV